MKCWVVGGLWEKVHGSLMEAGRVEFGDIQSEKVQTMQCSGVLSLAYVHMTLTGEQHRLAHCLYTGRSR